jgi:hypothetical protein
MNTPTNSEALPPAPRFFIAQPGDWPKASIAQARAIKVYHDAGWQINPQEDDGMIPCQRPETMETVEHSLITSDGRMIPWSNAEFSQPRDEA